MVEDDETSGVVGVDDLVSEEDALLYSTFAGPRIFILNDADKTNLLGLVLDESDDSFLVGLPASAFERDSEKQIRPYCPAPYMRLMKSATMSVLYTFGEIEDLYMKYLDTKGRELYPEVADYIEEGEEDNSDPAEASIVGPADIDISLSKDATPEQQVLGMTDEELRQYLLEKFNNGELANGSGKKH